MNEGLRLTRTKNPATGGEGFNYSKKLVELMLEEGAYRSLVNHFRTLGTRFAGVGMGPTALPMI